MPVFPETLDTGDPGDLINDDYQYEFRGVLLGRGTPFVVEKIEGLLGHAQTRSNDSQRAQGHGSYPGLLLYEPRIIQFDLLISTRITGESMEELLMQLSDAFQPPRIRSSRTPESFTFKRPGSEIKQFFCRATRYDAPSDYNVARGLATASVELVANDPLCYGLELKSESIVLGSGETFDQVDITNEGNHRDGTGPIITVTGPATDPIITNTDDDGRAIRLNTTLASNQTARINLDTLEVQLKTGSGAYVSNYSIVANDNQFWRLLPGVNTITYQRTGTTPTSTMTVSYYDCWARG